MEPDLIYLPEVAFDIDKFLVKVKDLLSKKASVVIAVSEGIKLADGRYVCELGNTGDYVDAFGHKQLQVQRPTLRTSWQQSADVKQEPLSFPPYRDAHPTWLPEQI